MQDQPSFWTRTVIPLSRVLIPRWLRNSLRRPRVTAKRVSAKAAFYGGKVARVKIRHDWELRCHPICEESFRVFAKDPAQRSELDQFVSHCKSGMRLLDVGSHWGVFALAAFRYGGDQSQVVCIEPSPSAIKILKANLGLNDSTGGVEVIEAAAGAEDGYLQMLTTGAGGDDFLVVPFSERHDTISIRQRTLDGLCAECHFEPSHVKIDVEGFEEDALTGALSILRALRPILFLELHGDLIQRRGIDPKTVLLLLKRAGYCRWEEFGTSVDENRLAESGYNARLVCFPEV
jgi:FkbM family methyltransferase